MHSRRLGLLTLALLLAAVFQVALGGRVTIFTARPDLVLLLVVVHAVVRGSEEGLLAGLLGGLLVDVLSAVPFGTATISMGLIGLATGLGEDNVYRANLIIPLVAVFLATVVYHSIIMLTLQAVGMSVDWISTLALQTVPGAVLNALLAPLAFALVRSIGSPPGEEEKMRW
ncbi:MAG: rod shape-determining protein MreD [Sphingomonadaceae bacterium]